MDKASVLGDAIKYLKHLQEKVKTLEEQSEPKQVESAVLVEKARSSEDDVSSSDENFKGAKPIVVDDEHKNNNYNSDENNKKRKNGNNAEIEAKLSEKSVLLRIHCRKSKGVLVKALGEIERLNLSVVNTNCVTFSSCAFDITVVAEIEEGFCLTVEELVEKLNAAFTQFM